METKLEFSKNSIMIKAIVVAVMTIVMLIPITLIESLIEERCDSQIAVQEEISQKWGDTQKITGPVLVLPIQKISKGDKVDITYAYFLPDELSIDGEIIPEERSRTLYQVLVYQSQMNVKGKFSFPDYSKLGALAENVMWNDAFVMLGVTNVQGIKNKIDFRVGEKSYSVHAGVPSNELIGSGLSVAFPIDPNKPQYFDFSYDISLNGSGGMYLTPVGKESHVHLKSPWKTVSFIGESLPTTRNITDSGFEAQWDVYDYNRNYTQSWIGVKKFDESGEEIPSFGVDFRYPVNFYQMNMRSVKYAIMFIALTFVVFFLVELLGRKRIHPIQYLLVSAALVLFYTLLLALSEHIGFRLSYLASATAVVLLVTAYSTSIFKSKKLSAMLAVFLIGLYVYLYVVLQMENMALLFGSIGLFVALAIIMFVSRKINWYKNDDEMYDDSKTVKEQPAADRNAETPPPFTIDVNSGSDSDK